MKRIVCISLLALFALAAFAGCTGNTGAINAEKAFNRIISEVTFADVLKIDNEYADFVFGDAVNGGTVRMYSVGDKFADAAIYFEVKDKADLTNVRAAVDEYLASRKLEADRYNPTESAKIDKAVVWTDDTHMIVCITDDVDMVNKILN